MGVKTAKAHEAAIWSSQDRECVMTVRLGYGSQPEGHMCVQSVLNNDRESSSKEPMMLAAL